MIQSLNIVMYASFKAKSLRQKNMYDNEGPAWAVSMTKTTLFIYCLQMNMKMVAKKVT